MASVALPISPRQRMTRHGPATPPRALTVARHGAPARALRRSDSTVVLKGFDARTMMRGAIGDSGLDECATRSVVTFAAPRLPSGHGQANALLLMLRHQKPNVPVVPRESRRSRIGG